MIRVELIKLVRRPRSWVSILLLCGLPVVVAVFVAVTHIAPPPGQGPALLSEVLSSGTLYPAAALAIVLPIFLPVAVAVVAGDAIAGEASAGTLRYLLARPVGRTRLLVAKLITLIVYTLSAVLLVAGTAYLTGIILFGSKPIAATPGGLTTSNIASAATSLSGTAMSPDRHRAAHHRGDRVHRGVHARRGRDRAVPVHHHRLRAGRGAGRAGRADHQRGAGHAERRVNRRPVPAHPVLAGLGSTSSATRSSGGTSSAASRCRRCTWWCSSAPPGRTSPPRM